MGSRQGSSGFAVKAKITRAALAISLLCNGAAFGASWETGLTASSPPAFPNPRPMHARYAFGWSGFPCATADIRLTKAAAGRLQLDLAARTTGLVRTLWKFDATGTSTVDAATLHPIAVKQVENDRSQKTLTELSFTADGVTSKKSPRRRARGRRLASSISRTCSTCNQRCSICAANRSRSATFNALSSIPRPLPTLRP